MRLGSMARLSGCPHVAPVVRAAVALAVVGAALARPSPALGTDPTGAVADSYDAIHTTQSADGGDTDSGAPTALATTPTTWRVAIVTYLSTDATCNGVRVTDAIGQFDRDRARNVAGYFAQQVSAYSDGMGALDVTYVERPSLTSVTQHADYCYPTPPDVEATGGFPVGFDHVHVQYPGDGLNSAFGLGSNCGGCTGFGAATYATSRIPHGDTAWWWNGTVSDAEVLTHEWLHDASAHFRKRGFDTPDPHEDASGRYWWSGNWHDALLSGDSLELATGRYVGWTSTVWAAGTPTRPLTPPPDPAPNPRTAVRAAGDDRYATAVAVSRELVPYPEGYGLEVVFVATGETFPDALAGGPAARAMGAPMLLVRRGGIPAATREELVRLRPASIAVLGGPGAVSDAVVAGLREYTRSHDPMSVFRLAGETRYDTAAAISRTAFANATDVLVATGTNYPDALVAAAAGGQLGMPLLLVAPDHIPYGTSGELWRLEPSRIWVLGGPAAVSDAVIDQLRGYTRSGTSPAVIRLGGPDRYVTAVEVSRQFFASNVAGRAWVATGRNFPDALAAAAAGEPLQLVPGTSVPNVVRHELARLNPERIVATGGAGVVSDAVFDSLRTP